MIFILVTCADAQEAEKIAARLVDERLAACVQIMPSHRSVYRWQDKIENNPEVNIIIKTAAMRFEDVRRAVKEMHSYDTPCIASWRVDDADCDFMDWLTAQTA